LIEEQPKLESNNNAIINLKNIEFIQVASFLSERLINAKLTWSPIFGQSGGAIRWITRCCLIFLPLVSSFFVLPIQDSSETASLSASS
jgi:hypothetical protein